MPGTNFDIAVIGGGIAGLTAAHHAALAGVSVGHFIEDGMPGGLVINVGELMTRWTNDHWPSTRHRVRRCEPAHECVNGQVAEATARISGLHRAIVGCRPQPPRPIAASAANHCASRAAVEAKAEGRSGASALQRA